MQCGSASESKCGLPIWRRRYSTWAPTEGGASLGEEGQNTDIDYWLSSFPGRQTCSIIYSSARLSQSSCGSSKHPPLAYSTDLVYLSIAGCSRLPSPSTTPEIHPTLAPGPLATEQGSRSAGHPRRLQVSGCGSGAAVPASRFTDISRQRTYAASALWMDALPGVGEMHLPTRCDSPRRWGEERSGACGLWFPSTGS